MKPKFLSKEERAKLAIAKRAAEIREQKEKEERARKEREDLERQGVIFMDTDTALKEHPEFFEEYFGTVIPVGDNKFAALNTSSTSNGSS